MSDQNFPYTNRLIHEKSPYLQQHAHNPVDWYPWGEEAFETARRENKPVFLSIGYSTCHWCHVMEHESFEDETVAKLMNEAFVNIKVDREERPDIDGIYMSVCQMTTGHGGWPLTIIMTPDRKPFFAGTYYPKHSRYGRMGMMDLVPRLQDAWENRQDEIKSSTETIIEALTESEDNARGAALGESELHKAFQQLQRQYDPLHGGLGTKPKFPTPHVYMFLLRYWKRTGNEKALEIVERTLGEMRRGGIYDQLGFGFHRYSTDREWLLPHFEKMLYDQALHVMAYTEAWQATAKDSYRETAREILGYVLRDMTSPEGGFYSAEDADSEGVEGKFYVWSAQEIREILDGDAELFLRVFNAREDGNFHEEATGEAMGTNILHLKKDLELLAEEENMSPGELKERIAGASRKLFEVRKKRIHPYKDDKILCDWNGLMIAAFAKAAQAFGETGFSDAAENAVRFIEERLRNESGELLHRYRNGEAGIAAHVDDYAFFVWGLIELYEATFKTEYLEKALGYCDEMLRLFWDDERDGLFFARESADLIVRKKEIYDGAIPSGNSVAMLCLLRLARMTGRTEYEERAEGINRAFSPRTYNAPGAHTQLMVALDFAVGPSYEIVIAGTKGESGTEAMIGVLREKFLPGKVLLFRGEQDSSLVRIAPFTAEQGMRDGKPTAYVCMNFACSAPVHSATELIEALR